jgi:aminoglycoside phosphotransferase (APT) family kinase protein
MRVGVVASKAVGTEPRRRLPISRAELERVFGPGSVDSIEPLAPGRPVVRVEGPVGSLVVKVRDSRDIQREAAVTTAAAGIVHAGTALVPRVVHAGGSPPFLALERLDGWRSLDELFTLAPEHDEALARALGAALAEVHRAPLPAGLPHAFPRIPELDDLDPAAAAALPGEMLVLVAELQSSAGLAEALAALAARPHEPAFVHGDAKLDNVLAAPDRPAVRLVDWELGGSGDPAWDVGSACGDYLFRWLRSARLAAGRTLRSWLEGATVPLRCGEGAVRPGVPRR